MAIINKNVQNVKFLRNGSVFNPSVDPVKTAREVALAAMNEQLNSLDDGTAILGRYQETNGVVKTLVGFAYVSGETKTLTVFDVEGASADVEKLKQEINAKLGDGITSANTATAQLTALSGSASDTSAATSVAGAKAYAKDYTDEQISSLDYTDTAVTGSYVSAVNEADGKISVSRVALPDASSVADDNKVVTDVTQSKGAITATAANITGVKLAGYAEGTDADIAATDTLGEALGKLQAQINAMDKGASAVNGQVVTTVSETDGKVSETKANVKDLQLGGYTKDTTATGDIASTDTINAALSKLENKAAAITIASTDKTVKVTTASTGTDISVNIDGTTLIKNASTGVISSDLKIVSIEQGTGSTYASQYQLVYGDSNQPIGEVISVGKDQFLKEADYDPQTQKLILTMWNSTGGTTDIEVDFSEAVIEAEAGEGLYVNMDNHSLNVGVANDSEAVTTGQGATQAVLVVGDDSIKVQGIQAAIDYKVSTLDADLSGNTTHVKVGVAEDDGKITAVTVDETDIASQSLLDELSGKTFTVAVSSNDSITTAVSAASDGTKSVDLITDASKIQMSGFTAAESGFTTIEQFSSVTEAFKAVETIFIDTEETISASLNDLEDRKAEKTELQSEFNTLNDRISDLESGSSADLSAEIEARKAVDGISAQTYVANVDKKYISGATSLNDADVKLNDALKNIEDNFVGQVKVNNKALAEVDNAVNVIINAGSNASNDTNAIHVDTNDNGDITLTLGTIDVGTY